MPTVPTEIKSLARTHTVMALRTLAGIARQPKAPAAARVSAAVALLDRGWGKVQADEQSDGDRRLNVNILIYGHNATEQLAPEALPAPGVDSMGAGHQTLTVSVASPRGEG